MHQRWGLPPHPPATLSNFITPPSPAGLPAPPPAGRTAGAGGQAWRAAAATSPLPQRGARLGLPPRPQTQPHLASLPRPVPRNPYTAPVFLKAHLAPWATMNGRHYKRCMKSLPVAGHRQAGHPGKPRPTPPPSQKAGPATPPSSGRRRRSARPLPREAGAAAQAGQRWGQTSSARKLCTVLVRSRQSRQFIRKVPF